MVKVEKFVIGIIGTNCYVVRNEQSKECIIIDPSSCPEYLPKYIKREGLTPKAILLTHGHFDHIMGVDGFLKEFDIPVYAHEDEQMILTDAMLNASLTYGDGYTFEKAISVKDGEQLSLAGFSICVIHTPGHTIGGCCYYIPDEAVLFSGDTLFSASIGRSDLPTGNGEQLIQSIKEKLLCLPNVTKVYPGHMDETTIEYEKYHNPYL